MLSFIIATGLGAAFVAVPRLFNADVRLSGRWEGDLTCDDPKYSSHVIHLILVIASPSIRPNSGLLHYTRQCSNESKIIICGLDELQSYTVKNNLLNCEVNMQFIRRLHKDPDGTLDYSKAYYQLRCNCGNLLRVNPSLRVYTEIRDRGIFHRWAGQTHTR